MERSALIQTVEAAQAGDERAFEALFRAYQNGVYGLAMHFCRDPEVAADVTQDAFVRAWQRLPKLRDPGAFEGWLKTTAMNLVRDHFRSNRDERPLDESNPMPSGEDGPAQMVEQADADHSVREAILDLPDHQREVVRMHYLEGRSVTEIMEALDLPKGTVVSRLSRGRKSLRRRLAPYIDDAGRSDDALQTGV